MKLVQVDRKYKKIIQDYKDEYLKTDDKINGCTAMKIVDT